MRIGAAHAAALALAVGAAGCLPKDCDDGGPDPATLTTPATADAAGAPPDSGPDAPDTGPAPTARGAQDGGTANAGGVPCPNRPSARCRVLTLEDLGAQLDALREERETVWRKLDKPHQDRIHEWSMRRPPRAIQELEQPLRAPRGLETPRPARTALDAARRAPTALDTARPVAPGLRTAQPATPRDALTARPGLPPGLPLGSPPGLGRGCPFCRPSNGSLGTSFDLIEAFDVYDGKSTNPGYPLHDVARSIKEALSGQGYSATFGTPPSVGKHTAEISGKRISDGVEIDVRADAEPDGLTVKLYYQGEKEEEKMRQLLVPIGHGVNEVIVKVVFANVT